MATGEAAQGSSAPRRGGGLDAASRASAQAWLGRAGYGTIEDVLSLIAEELTARGQELQYTITWHLPGGKEGGAHG
jgi:hypothetical protein